MGLAGTQQHHLPPREGEHRAWSITDMFRTLVALAVDQALCRIQSLHPTPAVVPVSVQDTKDPGDSMVPVSI